ncbi:MAG: glycosyltransferase [Ruminococcus sp.]|nr:glycosyltransferase [Ruminococcus sp.]
MNGMVSCIITTYNRPTDILKRAVDSVLNQTYKNIELIIVNDCPENTGLVMQIQELIDTYHDGRIIYIVHQKNMGACQARNTGIDASKGKYVALLDDDDEWLLEKLDEQICLFTNDKIGLVYCDAIIEKDGHTVINKRVPKVFGEDTIKALLNSNFIGSNSFPVMRREAVISAGMYDTSLKALQDLDMWIRIAQRYECVHCSKPLVINHISEVSITTISNNRVSAYKLVIDKYKDLYEKYPTVYHARVIGIAGELMAVGKFKDAWEYYQIGLQLRPLSIRNITIPLKSIIMKLRKKFFKH